MMTTCPTCVMSQKREARMSWERSKKSANEGTTQIMAATAGLSGTVASFKIGTKGDANEVKGGMNNLNSEMDLSVQHLNGSKRVAEEQGT